MTTRNTNLLNKTQNMLKLWSSRNLTLTGKITLVKTFIIPHMIYNASILALTIPRTFVTKVIHCFSNLFLGYN